jgi:hypothetical protein
MARVWIAWALVAGAIHHQTSFAACPIGAKIPDSVSMVDLRGNARTLADYASAKLRVVAFIAAECPVANLYVPVLVEMEKSYRAQGVQFLAVYPQANDSVDEIAVHGYDRGIPFPILKDRDAYLADELGIKRVPTVCVIDQKGMLRYRGRIDDQVGVGTRRPKATKSELRDAIDSLLRDQDPAVTQTNVDGCIIQKDSAPLIDGEVTFTKDVAKILQNKCEECHRPGRIGPFTLSSYDDAFDWADQIKEVVINRQMPPWHADERFGHFLNDRRLTDQERQTLLTWVDTGKKKGNDADLPPAKEWVEGWEMGKPDVVLTIPQPQSIPASGVVPYRYIIVPTGFTEDKWVVAAEGKPGNPAIVHHIIVYLMSPEKPDPFREGDGEMNVLTEWAPGNGPVQAAPGTALRVPKGATLLLEMHYTPNGTEQTDQSMVGIRFSPNPPERIIRANLFANELIRIPARDPHHRESRLYTFREDSRILALLPHMHWRGKHFEYIATYPDGKKERLLSVPRWDFNWQTGYWFREPIRVPKGTTVEAIATWDNSANNLANPDPNRDVTWGLQTWEEMMVGWMYYVRETPDTDEIAAAKNDRPIKLSSAGMFRIMDRDKNGWVAGKEIPPQFRPMLEQLGIDLRQGLDPVAYEFIYRIVMSAMKPSTPTAAKSSGQTTSNQTAAREGDKPQ